MFTSDETNIFSGNNGTNYSMSNTRDRDIPQITGDDTPLNSDIPIYDDDQPIFDDDPSFMIPTPNQQTPPPQKVSPFIFYETKEDVNANGVIDDIARMLA